MATEPRGFVVFSDDWGIHPSSCQHLFAQLARRHRVLWVNTIGLRAPKADRFTVARALAKFRQWQAPLRQVSEGFYVYSPAMLPASDGAIARLNSRWVAQRLRRVLWRCGMPNPVLFTSVPTAADYVGQLRERAVVYYLTDDYRHWPGGHADAIAAQDERLCRRADLLLPVSAALAEGRAVGGAVQMLPHGVDLPHFASVDGPLPEPPELAGVPHPRLCFFGLIYEKVDRALLARLARDDPRRHLVLLGPVKADVGELAALPNVHLLGPKPYADLPRYLKYMDVLLLPYVLDEQIRRSAPLKIRECLATGKPVVAVDVPDLRRFARLIRQAGNGEGFLAACRAACAERAVPVAEMRSAVAADTWQARAELVERAVEDVLAEKSHAARTPAHLRLQVPPAAPARRVA